MLACYKSIQATEVLTAIACAIVLASGVDHFLSAIVEACLGCNLALKRLAFGRQDCLWPYCLNAIFTLILCSSCGLHDCELLPVGAYEEPYSSDFQVTSRAAKFPARAFTRSCTSKSQRPS